MSVVVITLPANLSSDGLEVAVHTDLGIEVDVRPSGSGQAWTPLQHLGGNWEIRA